ncbi:unnamed protein product, partial [Chrysoparadoxa australica]
NVGAVDCIANKDMCRPHLKRGYPHLTGFHLNDAAQGILIQLQGRRMPDATKLMQWAMEYLDLAAMVPGAAGGEQHQEGDVWMQADEGEPP